MKKGVLLLGIILSWLLSVLVARADLIWVPIDEFCDEHEDECEYIDRRYIADDPDGQVIVYKSPEDKTEVGAVNNGEDVRISHVYTDENGTIWGMYQEIGEYSKGWITLEQMKVVYDWISFEEDYGSMIEDREGVLSSEYTGETLKLWYYPGARDFYEEKAHDKDLPTYVKIFVDEEGRSWGKIDYYYANQNCWICLDAPTANYTNLYPEGNAIQEKIEKDNWEKDNSETVILVVVIVLAVVAVTGLLLVRLKKRRNK